METKKKEGKISSFREAEEKELRKRFSLKKEKKRGEKIASLLTAGARTGGKRERQKTDGRRDLSPTPSGQREDGEIPNPALYDKTAE